MKRNSYSAAAARAQKQSGKPPIISHRSAFREVVSCQNCHKPIGPNYYRTTSFCKSCYAKAYVTCPNCRKSFILSSGIKLHRCFDRLTIREWRKMIKDETNVRL